MDSFDTTKDWVHYLTRPYTLFTASLWYRWYGKYWKDFYKLETPTGLIIEQTTGLARQYFVRDEFEKYHERKYDLFLHKKSKIMAALEKGTELNEESKNILEDKTTYFSNLNDAVDYLCKSSFYSTILAFTTLETANRFGLHDKELITKAEQLRNVSYYQDIQDQIVRPLAQRQLDSTGVKNSNKAVDLLTYSEIKRNDFSKLKERYDKRKNKEFFVIQHIDGEKIFWITNPIEAIASIENISLEEKDEIKGSTAYRGKVKGRVRIVVQPDQLGDFEEDEILVTTNSNPSFMPAIIKSAAIVTDEEGIMCHAAIVARELKKPCVIGMKHATMLLKDGDLVEVDAEKGIVRKIK